MRNAFADEVTQLAKTDSRVMLLSGDIGNKLFDKFKAVDAKRFLNCGIAEANMMGVAAGLALNGLRPIVYTITPFTTTRCFEQIRVDVCYHEAPVIIVGTGSGLSYAELGPTHHSLEDLAILRTLPGMQVLAPCDAIEMRLALREAIKSNQPTYIRIGKKGEPAIHDPQVQFQIGQAITVREGSDVLFVAAGTLMPQVLTAAEALGAQGISVQVASFHSIKPLDEAYLRNCLSRHKLIVTIEEHGRLGGLGSAVSEYISQFASHPPLLRLGTLDEFMHEMGTQDYARTRYGLDSAGIVRQVNARLADV
ncbi:transketolase subunit B [Jezberella montanilacus]|uniref:Transketolase subunit B n=1 Tax=Jezberella montanilacus TaxID=323426 RepID=A0A2T0XCC5_9BURK|nr:transketolase C-terminal domain-containing protein [Jezberella montanilacus]PRY96573.1 transketolase subunit B [Jezberella montanilacus]